MQIGASHQQELQACSSAYKQNVSKYNYLVHKLRNVDIQLSQCITNSNRSNMGGAGGSNHKNSVTCKDSVRRSASKGRDS